MNIFRHVTLFALIGCLFIVPGVLFAADVTTSIPQQTLNDYARAVGTVSGSGTYYYVLRLPRLVPLPSSGPQPTLPRPQELVLSAPYTVAYFPIVLRTLNWTWKVVAPSFSITPSGVTFNAMLSVSDGSTTSLQPVRVPVTVTYNASASTVQFTLASTPLPVWWQVMGRATQIGTVSVTPYYSTSLYVGSRSFTVGGRTITGSVANVATQFLNGYVQITNDVKF